MVTSTRRGGEWEPNTPWLGTSFHDLFTDPAGLYGLAGRLIVASGGSSGESGHLARHHSPGREIPRPHPGQSPGPPPTRQPLRRLGHPHREAGPFTVTVLDENGTTLAAVEEEPESLTHGE